jgi:predicted component of type VI protein secretion system
MATKQDLALTKDAEGEAREAISAARKTENFGNARFVRNLLENTLLEQAKRLMGHSGGELQQSTELTSEDLLTILPEDISKAALTMQPSSSPVQTHIGFVA